MQNRGIVCGIFRNAMQIPTGTDTDLLQQTGTESSLTARTDRRRPRRNTARIPEQPAAGRTGSPLYIEKPEQLQTADSGFPLSAIIFFAKFATDKQLQLHDSSDTGKSCFPVLPFLP